MTHAPLPSNSPANGPQTEAPKEGDFFAGMEQQLQRLRDVQREHAQQARIFAQRETELAEREVALVELETQLAERSRSISSEASALAERTASIERSLADADERAAELEDAQVRFAAEREALKVESETERELLEQERLTLTELRRTLEVEREALDAQLREAAAAQVDLLERIRAADVQQEELELQRMEIEELRATVAGEHAEIEERAAQLKEREQALRDERAELDEGIHEAVTTSAEALAERDESLERAENEVREAQARIETLMSDLQSLQRELASATDANTAAADAAAEEAAEQIESLTAERQTLLRRVVVLETNLTELTGKDVTETLRAELGVLRNERTQLLERLTETEASLQAATERAEALSTASEAPSAELQALRDQLLAVEVQLASESQAREAAESSVAELKEDAVRARDLADLAAHCREEAERTAEDLRAQIEALEEREKASLAAGAASAAGGAGAAQGSSEAGLREKAKRIADIARHLKLRQLRLERYRAVIQMRRGQEESASEASAASAAAEAVAAVAAVATQQIAPATDDAGTRAQRREADLEQHAAQVRHLEQQKHEVAEARRSLVMKERRMIRRWAQPRAIAVTAWLGLLLFLSAGASWLIVGHLYPPTISARVDMEPRSNRLGTLPEDLLVRWQRTHLDIVTSPAFHTQVARRMKDLKLPTWENESAVARTITQDLTTDLIEPGRITLVLAGKSRHEVTLFLDVLATTLAAESARQYRRLGDGVWAVAMGERRESDQLRYSTVNPVPMKDQRMSMFAPVLGAVFGVAIVVILVVYTQLSRVKREFDSDGALFDDEPIAAST